MSGALMGGSLAVDGPARVEAGKSGGMVVALALSAVDAGLAAIGFGDGDARVGVSFDHQCLLTVTAPATTMADLMDADGEPLFFWRENPLPAHKSH